MGELKMKPVVVRVTYIDDLPPWVEIWQRDDDSRDPPLYMYTDIMRPKASSDEEWMQMLRRAKSYVFVPPKSSSSSSESPHHS